MPKFAANLTVLFTEMPDKERYAAAAKAGFKGVESLFPYVHCTADLKDWLDAGGLEMVLINAPAGDWSNGERGLTCLPERESEYRDDIGQAIEYAQALGCNRIHAVAGLAPEDGPERTAFEDTYRENLAWEVVCRNMPGTSRLPLMGSIIRSKPRGAN